MLTDEELLEILRRGEESDRVEFTSEGEGERADDKIRRNVCAFSNDLRGHGKPGVLFIGVNDDGSCAKMPVTRGMMEKLSELRLNAGIHPFPIAIPDKKTLDGCEMAVVMVAPSHSPPVSYKGNIWVRSGPTCRKATREEEEFLIERRRSLASKPFDSIAPHPRAGVEDLDIGLFHEYLRMSVSPQSLAENERSDETRMRSMNFMTPDGEVTHGALLCFGKDPQRWLGGAYIQFLRCPGTDIVSAAEAVDHKEIRGTIFRQIRDIESLMKVHIQTPAIIGSPRRVDFPAYPAVALEQAIRNAVLHRSYEGTNAPIQCYWFSDRVEISSPGGPYGRVTVSNFGQEGLTDYRNLKLAEAMKDMEFIERYGFGIRAIRRSMERNGNPEPEFRVGETNATVVLRKLDLGALSAKAAELGCCQALIQFKREWDSNPGEGAIHIPGVLCLDESFPGFPAQSFSAKLEPLSAKEIAYAALREHTMRHRISETAFTPLVPMARIMHLLRELFGAEEPEMREKFKNSTACKTPDEEKTHEADELEFRRLAESPPPLSEVEADIHREAANERMQALMR